MKILIILLFSTVALAGEPIFPVTGRYLEPEAAKAPTLSHVVPWYEVAPSGALIQTSDTHLIRHGANPQLVAKLSPGDKNRLHGVYHRNEVQSRPSVQNCPGGNCPLRRSR